MGERCEWPKGTKERENSNHKPPPAFRGLSFLAANHHVRFSGQHLNSYKRSACSPSDSTPTGIPLRIDGRRPGSLCHGGARLLIAQKLEIAYDQGKSGSPWVIYRQPLLYSAWRVTLDWQRAAATADQIEPQMKPLHDLLRNPPPDPGWTYTNGALLHGVGYPEMRLTLHDLAIIELQRGRLSAAHTNLLSLPRVQDAWASAIVCRVLAREASWGFCLEHI
jgi:hypothetical protein